MASIGQELKRERELRGISLKEIADSTKINMRFLRALEEDRFDMLPEQFFTRGIIRTYAKYLGLDEQSVLNTYLEGLQARETQGATDEERKAEMTDEAGPLPNKRKSLFFFILAVLTILIVIVILYNVFQSDKNLPPDTSKIQSVPQKTPEKTVTLPPPAQEEPEETRQEDLTIEISVLQETWIEVFADQDMLDSGVKYPEERLQFKARQEFLIHIGNAGGITFTINGQKGISLGEPGTVRRDIRITLDNFQDFVVEEELT